MNEDVVGHALECHDRRAADAEPQTQHHSTKHAQHTWRHRSADDAGPW